MDKNREFQDEFQRSGLEILDRELIHDTGDASNHLR